jgi:predicted esterase
MTLETLLGRAMQGVEKTFTAGWSLGELAWCLRQPGGLLRDPWRAPVLEDIRRNGLYRDDPEDPRAIQMRHDGLLVGPNPYRYLRPGQRDKVVAQMLDHHRPRARRLLVVCHCYGLPIPALMERLFGLDALVGYDVVYNIMNHHYLGSFEGWPGFGLMNPQLSQVIESLRAAVVGLRALIRALQLAHGYEEVALLGYSIGGQLALHVANLLDLDRLLLYCPVVSVRETVSQLGLMPWLRRPVEGSLRRLRADFRLDDLDALDPLAHPWRLDPARALVVVQSYDAMVSPAQMGAIRHRYPTVGWMECPGTHTWPARRAAFHRAMRAWLERGPEDLNTRQLHLSP